MNASEPSSGFSDTPAHTSPQRLAVAIVTIAIVASSLIGCSENPTASSVLGASTEVGTNITTDSEIPNSTSGFPPPGDSNSNGMDIPPFSSPENVASVSTANGGSQSSSDGPETPAQSGGQATVSSIPPRSTTTTTIARAVVGGAPLGPPPVAASPPPSPPLIGPQTTTTIPFIGPTLAPTPTTTIDTGPFRCVVQVARTSSGTSTQFFVNVRGANRSQAWVVLNWSDRPVSFGLELVNGEGSRTLTINEMSLPFTRVFADADENPGEVGCQQI